jgi:hypothetical protein
VERHAFKSISATLLTDALPKEVDGQKAFCALFQ